MRNGFTTGSCAAVAAKAAGMLLLIGSRQDKVSIITPKGIEYKTEICDLKCDGRTASCGVIKDGGDDPDITTGTMICVSVSYENVNNVPETAVENGATIGGPFIYIDGGKGVGRVTKPGLDQPVGNAAINHVPREMITNELVEICNSVDFKGNLYVIVSVPDGEEIAKKTFNPRLGIVGGISIIGTSGIVEPMSSQALLDTIKVELNQRRRLGFDYVAVAPGNYGIDYLKNEYGYDLDRSVKCSNFIGATIDMAVSLGFKTFILTGHIGKLVKVAGGIMNTHSQEGDCRMEILSAAALKCMVSGKWCKDGSVKEKDGVSAADICYRILDCVVTEEAVRILDEVGIKNEVMEYLMTKIQEYLNKRAGGKMNIVCIMYSNDFGELSKSEGAEKWLTLLAQEQAQ